MPRQTIQEIVLGHMAKGKSLFTAITDAGLAPDVVARLLSGDVEFNRKVSELRGRGKQGQ